MDTNCDSPPTKYHLCWPSDESFNKEGTKKLTFLWKNVHLNNGVRHQMRNVLIHYINSEGYIWQLFAKVEAYKLDKQTHLKNMNKDFKKGSQKFYLNTYLMRCKTRFEEFRWWSDLFTFKSPKPSQCERTWYDLSIFESNFLIFYLIHWLFNQLISNHQNLLNVSLHNLIHCPLNENFICFLEF